MDMIRLGGVTYRYPEATTDALQGFSWHVQPGSFVLVAGRSGSGKSTVLRCLNGLVPHFYGGRFGGSVRVAGQDAVALGPAGMSATVGFVFQDPEAQAVLPIVEEEVAFGLENLGLPAGVMRRRVEEVLDLLAIAHLRRREISTLSGGERQRVAVAAVLATQPAVLVLDEPTSQLDPLGAEEVIAALERLNSDLGLTIVLAEHRLERVLGHADRLLYLRGDGLAAVDGPVRAGIRSLPHAPPMVEIARRLEWEPLPLTIREGRQHAAAMNPTPLGPLGGTVSRGGPPALEMRGLSFAYGRQRVLDGIDLRVESGELVALMGRNGAGKSTLLRLVMGLLRPDRGTLRIMGQAATTKTTAEIARLAGYVPQQPGALLFAETVRDEIAYTRRQFPAARPDDVLLEALDLTALAASHPRDLSTGEQQRVALAAIMAAGPRLLLLDEPTRGLDYAHKARLADYLMLLRQSGVAVVLATHDVELVARCADRVVMLGDGDIVADGSPRTVLAGSLTFAPQINRLFGGQYLVPEDVLGGPGGGAR
jgi:energy-coupling factor transport system ATP-binding protein